ncbi:hypothetical protein ALC56_14912 [Trachymyrmex septentrionalis]|uniref:Uncharacterized protein n=1 Tax=Trachymyrmex septentrionalis TaxID=34720 RepID=A0A195ES73_9HYME|nr:hypothetical protein ALC56_14912 [Trachymyrmex septentrionalis]
MTGTHVPIALRYCSTDGEVPILPVHVMYESTCLRDTISPVDFLNFFNWRKKYQNLDLATIASGANILILYSGVVFSFSVGSLRPIT